MQMYQLLVSPDIEGMDLISKPEPAIAACFAFAFACRLFVWMIDRQDRQQPPRLTLIR